MANVAPSSDVLGIVSNAPTQEVSPQTGAGEFGRLLGAASSANPANAGVSANGSSENSKPEQVGKPLPKGQAVAPTDSDLDAAIDADAAIDSDPAQLLQHLGKANKALNQDALAQSDLPNATVIDTDPVAAETTEIEAALLAGTQGETESTDVELLETIDGKLAKGEGALAQPVDGLPVQKQIPEQLTTAVPLPGVVVPEAPSNGLPQTPVNNNALMDAAPIIGQPVDKQPQLLASGDNKLAQIAVHVDGDSIQLTNIALVKPTAEQPSANAAIASTGVSASGNETAVKQILAGDKLSALVQQTADPNIDTELATKLQPQLADASEVGRAKLLDGLQTNNSSTGLAANSALTQSPQTNAAQAEMANVNALRAAETEMAQQARADNRTMAANADALLRQPVESQRLAPELQNRLQAMINSDKMTAELRLDPPELGAMKVRIQMNGDQANVQIVTQQGQARELLEQALPRLREMLQQQGLQLGQADISQQQSGQQAQGQGSEFGGQGTSGSDDAFEGEAEMVTITNRTTNGGIDYYA